MNMKTTWILRRLASLLILLALLSPLGDGMGAPALTETANSSDLAAQVTIRRDNYGVPHILALTEEAAAFGHGYAVAEDHFLELARLFLKARSEESTYFGEKFVETDFAAQELRLYEYAQSGYAKMPPWVQRIVDGYAAGYSRYVAQHRAELPE